MSTTIHPASASPRATDASASPDPERRTKRRPEAPSPAPGGAEFSLDAPELYLNRELTLLAFNQRVLHMSASPQTPLLERVKFLAIVSSNLDEFFMKRIGGLKQQIAAGIRTPTVDGRTPAEQVAECQAVVRDMIQQQNGIYRQLLGELDAKGIHLVKYSELDAVKRDALREQFITNIFPLLTPLALDPAHPFPLISNLALNLLVAVRHPGGSAVHIARIKVPVAKDMAPRFLRVGDENTFVAQDDVIANNLDLLFPGMEIVSCEFFRVTRNAIVEIEEEEADDLLAMIETELRHRHFAPIVRLEVMKGIDPTHRGMLAAELG
ncbi:MAG: RNA degradosome polyphosphate kinase, partial [Gammaproteobacteria bacterium]